MPKKKNPGRPRVCREAITINLRMERDDHILLRELAAEETVKTKYQVSVVQLIRDAIKYVYRDNERLRHCFFRARPAHRRK